MIPKRQQLENPGQVRQKNELAILESAEIEFSQYGFEGATIRSIANRAGLPKANVHYYFKSKLELYGAVLMDALHLWYSAFDGIDIHSDPAQAIESYIRAKVRYSKNHARAARLFAGEMIGGAPYLKTYLENDFPGWVSEKLKIFDYWISQNKMAAIKPLHLLIMIWGSTQYLADFQVQIESAMKKTKLSNDDYEGLADSLVAFVLKSCDLKKNEKNKPGVKKINTELEEA